MYNISFSCQYTVYFKTGFAFIHWKFTGALWLLSFATVKAGKCVQLKRSKSSLMIQIQKNASGNLTRQSSNLLHLCQYTYFLIYLTCFHYSNCKYLEYRYWFVHNLHSQEIYLLSQLSHPNIVQYYGSELVNSESTEYSPFLFSFFSLQF